MITVFLRGGLGNQMFQYALGLNLAKRNGTGVVFDTVFLNDRFPRREFSYRDFEMDIFSFESRFTLLSRISEKIPIPGLWLAFDLALMKVRSLLEIRKIVREKEEYNLDSEVLKKKGNLLLWGRWQNCRYLSGIEDELRSAFRFRQSLSGKAAKAAEEIGSSNSVSIHVRRGDYVKFESMKAIVGETNLDYYNAAVRYVAERVKQPHFFVFSDDIPWCRENLKFNFPCTFLAEDVGGPKNSFYLELMSLCKHDIIANSTFSFWGAWLNGNPGKIVVAPKRWCADPEMNGRFSLPNGWTKI
jgi:hypothetical protein